MCAVFIEDDVGYRCAGYWEISENGGRYWQLVRRATGLDWNIALQNTILVSFHFVELNVQVC